jgi:hypothetical protein
MCSLVTVSHPATLQRVSGPLHFHSRIPFHTQIPTCLSTVHRVPFPCLHLLASVNNDAIKARAHFSVWTDVSSLFRHLNNEGRANGTVIVGGEM